MDPDLHKPKTASGENDLGHDTGQDLQVTWPLARARDDSDELRLQPSPMNGKELNGQSIAEHDRRWREVLVLGSPLDSALDQFG